MQKSSLNYAFRGLANPDKIVSPDITESGKPYDDNYVDDEFYWAACELYITTGNLEYRNYIRDNSEEYFLKLPGYLPRPNNPEWKNHDPGVVDPFNWRT